MKKIGITLSMVLLLGGLLVGSALAASQREEDVFNVMVAEDTEYDGYLFQLADGAEPIEADGIEQIADGLYLADSVADVQDVYDGEDLEYIEPNIGMELMSVPNDPYYIYQREYMELINAPKFWDMGLTGENVKVAVIDSGVSRSVTDIPASRIAAGYNYVDGNSDTTDNYGHGTIVAEIMMATRNNGIGTAGLLSGIQVVPLKAADNDKIYLSTAVLAIYGAVDTYGCSVINMSWGATEGSSSLQDAINYAISKNVILVAAVGNDGNSTVFYPAGYSGVIGVGSVKADGGISDFSNRNSSVFVTAPGDDITAINVADGKYYGYSGTSCAAPVVSAMAAVSKAKWGNDLSGSAFKTILQNSVNDAGASGYDTSYGYGIIDLEKFGYYHTDNNFYDVVGHWGYNIIQRAYNGNLFSGATSSTFEPETEMTRAMYVTVLGKMYKNAGGTIPDVKDTFRDTDKSGYYTSFVAWASENGIVEGYGGNSFGPNDPISREQAAVILYKFTKNYLGIDVGTVNQSAITGYSDYNSVSSWARESLAWTVESNIISGVSTTSLDSQGTATRAQVAAILVKFLEGDIWTEYGGLVA